MRESSIHQPGCLARTRVRQRIRRVNRRSKKATFSAVGRPLVVALHAHCAPLTGLSVPSAGNSDQEAAPTSSSLPPSSLPPLFCRAPRGCDNLLTSLLSGLEIVGFRRTRHRLPPLPARREG